LSTVELQAYFNSLQPKLSPKTIRLIHGTLRAALNQGIAWGMLSKNPAVGVKLPRKHASASRLRCWDFRLDRHGDRLLYQQHCKRLPECPPKRA
jgi:hypothetical protein